MKMASHRLFALALLPFLSLGSGCAGGGPDLRGPEGPALMAAYSGDWVLCSEASENLGEKLRDALRNSPGDLPPGMTGGRRVPVSGGGRRGGGMRGGMGGTQIDPEAMRAAMNALRLLARVPRDLTLTLQSDRFTLTESGSGLTEVTSVTSLALDAEKEDLIQAGVRILGSAKWKKEGVELTREIEPAGSLEDTFILNDDGSLTLRREVSLRGRSVNGTLVFRKGGQARRDSGG